MRITLRKLMAYTPDAFTLEGVQNNVQEALDRLQDFPIVFGVLKEGVTLNEFVKNLEHGLGRRPRGWIVVKRNNSGDVWTPPGLTNPDPKRYLQLRAEKNMTVSIWIF